MKLNVKRDGYMISGELLKPEGETGRLPLVIMSHGFGRNRGDERPYAQSVLEKGIAVYIYDFIGGGPDIKSDGDMTEMSVLTEAQDLMAVVDAMVVRDDIDPQNIILLGTSQGGFVSAYVAAKLSRDIRGLILLYPAFVLQDDCRDRHPDGNYPAKDKIMGLTVGRVYYEDATSFDIFDVITNYRKDTLIIHGDADVIAPLSYSYRAQAALAKCMVQVLPGAGHGFEDEDLDEACALIGNFLDDVLQ